MSYLAQLKTYSLASSESQVYMEGEVYCVRVTIIPDTDIQNWLDENCKCSYSFDAISLEVDVENYHLPYIAQIVFENEEECALYKLTWL